MSKFILIILMAILPLQAFAALERNITHVLGRTGESPEFVIKHIGAHADRVMHHHDDHDEGSTDESASHVDKSPESYKHISDFELSSGMNFLLPAANVLKLPAIDGIAPAMHSDAFSGRTTTPLLRPPRAFA